MSGFQLIVDLRNPTRDRALDTKMELWYFYVLRWYIQTNQPKPLWMKVRKKKTIVEKADNLIEMNQICRRLKWEKKEGSLSLQTVML